jgi:pyruvate carboxylase
MQSLQFRHAVGRQGNPSSKVVGDMALRDAVIAELAVSQGQAIEAKDLLLVMA